MIITHHDNNRKGKKKIFFLLAILLILYGFFFSPASNFLSGVAHTIVTPVWKAGQSTGNTFSPFLGYVTSRRALYIENKELKQQVEVLQAKLADRSLLRDENKELKKMLGRVDEEKRVTAIVLVKPNQTPYDTLVVDVGSTHGVAIGNLVVLENVLLGEVTDVYPMSSKVKLYSTAGEKKQVLVGTASISAEATGLGAGNFEILMPRDSEVFVGDTVFVPSIQSRVLGVVGKIEEDPVDAFDRVYFISHVNPFTVSYVEVVLNAS